MKTIVKFSLLFLFSIYGITIQAQSIVKHFTIEDGLPSNEVHYVHQDSFGYLWFCTDKGVSRYNGSEFTNFSITDGLTSNVIFKVFEDKHSNLWFTSLDGGINIYNHSTQKFTPFKHNDWLLSKHAKQLWTEKVGFYGDDVYFFMSVNEKVDSIYHLTVNDVLKSYSYTEFIEHDELQLDNLVFLGPSFRGSRMNYLTVRASKAHSRRSVLLASVKKAKVQVNGRHPVLTEIDERLVLAQNNGVFEIKDDGNLFPVFKGVDATSVIKDRQNLLWVTTLNQGVYALAMNDFVSAVESLGLEKNDKITLGKGLGGNMLIGTDKGNLFLINDIGEKLNNYRLENGGVKGLFYSPDSSVLYFTDFELSYKSGVYIENNKENSVLNFLPSEMIFRDTVVNNDSMSLYKGVLYNFISGAGTSGREFSNHLVQFFIESNKYKELLDLHLMINITVPEYKFGKNCVYIANSQGLLKVYNDERPNEIIDLKVSKNTVGVGDLDVLNDYIFLSTKGYGVQVVKNDTVMASITVADDLISDKVNTVFIDNKNEEVWCGTDKGISIFKYQLNEDGIEFSKKLDLTKDDGLFSNYVNDISPNGSKIFVMSDLGVTIIPKNQKIGDVSSLILNKLGMHQEDSLYLEDSITLAYDQNNVEFFYEAVSTKKVSKMYRHRLIQDSDTGEWVLTDHANFRINNLAPASYGFEVCARAANVSWSEPECFSFIITPRFIDRLWVRIVVFLLVLGAFYGFYRIRISQLTVKSNLVVANKDLELKNIELESKALRGQMNPHFVFNVLNSIQKLILKENKEDANQLLSKFSKLIRSSLQYSRLEFIPIEDEITFLENYVSIEGQRFPGRFEYSINVDQELLEEEVNVPPLLIQPLCENAIKHAFVNGTGELKISIQGISETLLEVKVIDNGIGILNNVKKAKNQSLGLEIVKGRLELFVSEGFEASMEVEPLDAETNEGTVVTLVLPYK
ncbi:MAG: hypothetical protein COA58_12090 [Bacteroidetes bacterium]|nr:MAG: hypothetical protein COA58_12090 [Bacteroidota bacterium]